MRKGWPPAEIEIGGLFSRSGEAFFVLNERGALVYANPAMGAMLEIEPADRGRWRALETGLLRVPADLPAGQPRWVERSSGDGRRQRWFHILFVPLHEPDGGPLGVLGWLASGRRPLDVPKPVDSLAPERVAKLRQAQLAQWGFEAFPAQSPLMRRVLEQVRLAIASRVPILLTGEAGTGKTALARLIHAQTFGTDGRLACLDCRALPPDLLRQELLGPEDAESPGGRGGGLLAAGGSGTLILCGLLALPADLQQALVEAGRPGPRDPAPPPSAGPLTPARPQGQPGQGDRSGAWRLIVTERSPLEPALGDGRLLASLGQLVSVLRIDLPPLRERAAEFQDHCAWVLARLGQKTNGECRSLDPEALEVLARYDWPGNLRELEAVLEQACQRTTSPVLAVSDLPRRLRQQGGAPALPLHDHRPPPLDRLLEEVERRMLGLALAQFKGNKSKAAEHLGISRARLHRRVEQLGLETAEG